MKRAVCRPRRLRSSFIQIGLRIEEIVGNDRQILLGVLHTKDEVCRQVGLDSVFYMLCAALALAESSQSVSEAVHACGPIERLALACSHLQRVAKCRDCFMQPHGTLLAHSEKLKRGAELELAAGPLQGYARPSPTCPARADAWSI